ncbi:hypothetical protein LZ023_32440 [Pseudomonas silvicola]|nr:hypothetical protein LZ023_32440 [Pseudomonas silvicola]
MKSSVWLEGSYQQRFADLRRRFGEAAADVRHELFYLGAGRQPWRAGLRALVAWLRDTWQLLRQPGHRLQGGERPMILLATLAGVSGWGTLLRALPALAAQPRPVLVLAHPRLPRSGFPADLPVLRPSRPSPGVLWNSLRTLLRGLAQGQPLLLASCLARRCLWQGSLQRTLGACQGVLVLHNDFDLMSRASLGQGLPAICLQHGVPTDEFFPVRADWYLVWGASSRRAFVAAGCPDSALIDDSLGRAGLPVPPPQAPQGLALLSQTHAPVLGSDIKQRLWALAAELLRLAPHTRILLHPLETEPYHGVAAAACSRPPHPVLRAGGSGTQLVVGYCSTAMLEAALAGHWVVALQWPLPGNQAARAVLAAPLHADSAQQVVQLYGRLRHDAAFREQAADAQARWLQASFSEVPGGFAGWLERIAQGSSAEVTP